MERSVDIAACTFRVACLCTLMIAACGKGSPAVETGSEKPLAPAGAMTVATSAEAAAAVGKTVRVEGTARDAKISAVVISGDLVLYCLDVDRWPDERSNQTVIVSGALEHTEEFGASKDGPISAGTSGYIYVIRTCAVE